MLPCFVWLSSLSSCLPCYLFAWGKNRSSRRQLEFGAATLLTESVKGGCQIQELPLAAAETRLSCGRSQRLMGLSMCASERAANCYHSPWNRFGPGQLAPSQTMSEHSLGTSMGLGLFLISCVDEAILGFGLFFWSRGEGEKEFSSMYVSCATYAELHQGCKRVLELFIYSYKCNHSFCC